MSNLTVPPAFQEKLRDAMFEKFMELFPKEQLEKAIDSEITAFFELDVAPFTKTTVKVDNPNYRNSWDSRTIDIPAMTSVMKITPFRQLVWEAMHDHMRPVVDEVVADRKSQFGKAFADYIGQSIKPAVENTLNANMHTLGAAMASSIMNASMNASVDASHQTLQQAMRMLNVPPETINGIPKFEPPALPTYVTPG